MWLLINWADGETIYGWLKKWFEVQLIKFKCIKHRNECWRASSFYGLAEKRNSEKIGKTAIIYGWTLAIFANAAIICILKSSKLKGQHNTKVILKKSPNINVGNDAKGIIKPHFHWTDRSQTNKEKETEKPCEHSICAKMGEKKKNRNRKEANKRKEKKRKVRILLNSFSHQIMEGWYVYLLVWGGAKTILAIISFAFALLNCVFVFLTYGFCHLVYSI